MKGPDDPPHLLVIDHIDHKDHTQSEYYIECPYTSYSVRVVTNMLEQWGGKIELGNYFYEYWVHSDSHYCTMSTDHSEMRPQIMMDSVWNFDGLKRCATIEVNQRVLSRGGCIYSEVAAEEGILELLLDRWVSNTEGWPEELPQRPGEYPIYYWSNKGYYRDDFSNGFTLDPLAALDLSGVG